MIQLGGGSFAAMLVGFLGVLATVPSPKPERATARQGGRKSA